MYTNKKIAQPMNVRTHDNRNSVPLRCRMISPQRIIIIAKLHELKTTMIDRQLTALGSSTIREKPLIR